MVETRSGRSVSPDPAEEESGPGPSPRLEGKQKDTAASGAEAAGGATTGITARAGRGAGGRPGRAASAGRAGGLSDSQAFSLLALALGMLALPCIFTPKLAARLSFGSAADPPEDQHTHTLGLLACGLLGAASAAFALEECARKHMLHTFTADTLKLALAVFALSSLMLQFYYPFTLTPWAAIVTTVANAATFALPASQLFVGAEDRNRVWRDFRRLPHNLRAAVWLRKVTLPGALYLLLTMVFPVVGAAYFMAPKFTLYHTFGYAYGKSTYMAWKAVGVGLMTVLPAMTYTLKDKAENDLLGRSISRTLNIGLMLASIGHLLVFGPVLNQGHGGFMLPFLTASWATALLASMAGLAAPEASALLEATTEAARTE